MDGSTLDRGTHRVAVTEAQALGMIGVVRSLGAAGYRVHALSASPDALGFSSRYASAHAVHPAYGSAGFADWLEQYCHRERIDCLVPSEGLLHALGGDYGRFAPLMPDAVPAATWRRAMSKVDTWRRLRAAGADAHLPDGGVIDTSAGSGGPAPSLDRFPVYLKGDAGYSRRDKGGTVRRCRDAAELEHTCADLSRDYTALLWQEHVTGRKVGVSLWRHHGHIRARSMVLGIHERPHTGGMMSLRESFWHEAIMRDAITKLEAMEWEGVAMMEYKWQPDSDRFWFIEINARYWGYLHLDLHAGKDFPRLQVDAHFGLVASDLGRPVKRVVCRHAVVGEVSHLASLWKDPDVSIPARVRATGLFLALFLWPLHHADLLYPGDRQLYWREAWRFARGLLGRPGARP